MFISALIALFVVLVVVIPVIYWIEKGIKEEQRLFDQNMQKFLNNQQRLEAVFSEIQQSID